MSIFKKALPILAIVMGVSLAMGSLAFKKSPVKKDTEFFWVLKSGTTATTNETSYEEGSNGCANYIHFCGFYAPKDGMVDKPLIQSGTNLYNDLSSLNSDPNGHYDDSNKVTFQDNE